MHLVNGSVQKWKALSWEGKQAREACQGAQARLVLQQLGVSSRCRKQQPLRMVTTRAMAGKGCKRGVASVTI